MCVCETYACILRKDLAMQLPPCKPMVSSSKRTHLSWINRCPNENANLKLLLIDIWYISSHLRSFQANHTTTNVISLQIGGYSCCWPNFLIASIMLLLLSWEIFCWVTVMSAINYSGLPKGQRNQRVPYNSSISKLYIMPKLGDNPAYYWA